jgi:hypothetical protein
MFWQAAGDDLSHGRIRLQEHIRDAGITHSLWNHQRLHEFPDYRREWYGGNLLILFECRQNAGWGEEIDMRWKYLLVILGLATMVHAKDQKHYQSGKLLRMESVKCGTDEKNGKSFAGEMIGTDSSHMKTHELLCQQYTLETNTLVYTIRPKDDKHPALLPIGEAAQFRLDKDKMLLRVEDMDDKERQYIVVSIVPKGQAETAHNLTPKQ